MSDEGSAQGQSAEAVQSAAGASLARLSMAAIGAAVLADQMRRLLKQELPVRAGDDAEAVHRMRVATRRLRTALRVFRPWLGEVVDPGDVERAAATLRELAAALGVARDLDVFAAGLRDHASGAAESAAVERLLARRMAARADAHECVVALLDAEPFHALAGPFRAAIEAARPSGRPRSSVGRVGPRLLARCLRALRRSWRGLTAPTTPHLHRIRIRAKRLRYAAEFLAPDFAQPEDAQPTAVDELAELGLVIQDALGAALDAERAVDEILVEIERAAVSRDPTDAAALARIVRARIDERRAMLDQLASLWPAVPTPRKLRARLADVVR